MDRRKLDRAFIFVMIASCIVLLLVLIDAKMKPNATEIRPPMAAIYISEETACLPTVCDFGGCPVEKPITTEAETEEPTEPETEELIFAEEETEPEYDADEDYEEAYIDYDAFYSPSYFQEMGLIEWGDWTFSWYSERVLPGTGLDIPGRYTDGMGYVRDGDGYICVASDVLPHGTVIDTPFGSMGKVYDCGVGHDDWIDVYVGW